jgi:hypothetical protein
MGRPPERRGRPRVYPNGLRTCALRPAADVCRKTLYKNDGPVVELNRVTRLASRWLGKKMSEILLRFVILSDLSLQEIGQSLDYRHR